MSNNRMSTFQKRADKLLTAHGWRWVRFSGNGNAIYVAPDGERSTAVANSPKNPTDAIKQVCKYAGIKPR